MAATGPAVHGGDHQKLVLLKWLDGRRACPSPRRFSDSAGLLTAREHAASDVAFHVYDRVGTPDETLSELNSPACVHP